MLLSVLTCAALCGAAVAGSDAPESTPDKPSDRPLDLQQVERATVRLVLLDMIVLDAQGRTVPDLTAADFEVVAGGEVVEVDTLDVSCPAGATEDALAANREDQRESPQAPEAERKIVLLLDYLHLDPMLRVDVLERARRMVEHDTAEGEEIMVVALTGGLRIEQPFTSDRKQVQRSLKRMEYDVSLWMPDFFHITETGFVQGMTALFDVLGTVPGPKAVVMFSAMKDVPLDLEFREIAAVAAGSRCMLYPVDAVGLRPPPTLGPGSG